MCLIATAQAEVYFKYNESVSINIPCIDNGGSCSSTTACNISITKVENGQYLVYDIPTYKLNNGDFQYNTSFNNYGDHTVKMVCTDGTTTGITLSNVKVTPTGREETTGEVVINALILFVCLVIFIITAYLSFALEGTNQLNDEGFLSSINYMKYVKIFLMGIAYISAWISSYFTYIIAGQYLLLTSVSELFNLIFNILSVCFIPLLIIVPIYVGFTALGDKHMLEDMQRGLKPR